MIIVAERLKEFGRRFKLAGVGHNVVCYHPGGNRLGHSSYGRSIDLERSGGSEITAQGIEHHLRGPYLALPGISGYVGGGNERHVEQTAVNSRLPFPAIDTDGRNPALLQSAYQSLSIGDGATSAC